MENNFTKPCVLLEVEQTATTHQVRSSDAIAEKQNPTMMKFLRRRINGSVVAYGEKAYDGQRTPWPQVGDQHPAAIVARACDGGILTRLTGMKAISVDREAKTPTIEPGVSSGELLAAAEPHGLGYASGQVSNVGVVGYTLGGGVGWIGRKIGVACHTVVSATVVFVDKPVVTASGTEYADLLWVKKPVVDDLRVRLLSEMASFDEASGREGSPTYGHLECLRELTDDVLQQLARLRREKIPPLMQIELQHLGGELSAECLGATAYTAPQAPFSCTWSHRRSTKHSESWRWRPKKLLVIGSRLHRPVVIQLLTRRSTRACTSNVRF